MLLVKPSIIDLDIYAPDPNKQVGIWVKVYTEAAGEATLSIELYDSITQQILVRALDTKKNIGDTFGWYEPRNHYTNVTDARQALNSWAKMLAKGLNRAMAAKPKK